MSFEILLEGRGPILYWKNPGSNDSLVSELALKGQSRRQVGKVFQYRLRTGHRNPLPCPNPKMGTQ